eukprot:TRINITY_DN3289_c0_g1_i1.p1 TRINITY_DN3289_c0_g1~~TRINITY_DN3289_c0_g1_i1.p1  ORF type:complete len:665 (-),score=156.22 TRINITY_DN3289_c0_g1_i1:9-2003(-)
MSEISLDGYQSSGSHSSSSSSNRRRFDGLRKELERLGLDKAEADEIVDITSKKLASKSHTPSPSPSPTPTPTLTHSNSVPALTTQDGRSLSQRSRRKSGDSSSSSDEKHDKINHNLTEQMLLLVESERLYVKDLGNIVENWLVPIRNAAETGGSDKKIFENEDILKIFANIEIIFNIHSELLREIQAGTVNQVGAIFIKRIPFMAIYSKYVNNWNTATVTLNKYKESKAYQMLQMKNNSELATLLSKPLQRIDFYAEKLKEIEKMLPIGTPGVKQIQEAIQKLTELSDLFRREHEEAVNSTKIGRIKTILVGYPYELAQPGRQFLRVGDLLMMNGTGVQPGEKKTFTFILFNDILMYCEKQSKQLKFKAQVDLKRAQVVTRSQRFSMMPAKLGDSPKVKPKTKISSPTDLKNAINIICDDQMLAFCANSFEERESWLKDLEQVIQAFFYKRVFGVSLVEIFKRKHQCGDNGIPFIVKKLVEFFDEKTLQTEGLFRISASQLQLDSYRQELDDGNDVGFLSQQVHIVANLLKVFFRELPEPLIPFAMYEQFQEIAGIGDPEGRVRGLQLLIPTLPNMNRRLLQYLILFLTRVASHSNVNKMVPKNLGIVFEPNILKKKSSTQTDLARMAEFASLQGFLIETMILHYNQIFGKSDLKSSSEAPTRS